MTICARLVRAARDRAQRSSATRAELIGHTSWQDRPYGATVSAIPASASSSSLRSLALRLDIPERTIRRAAVDGLIRGERVSPRKFRTSLREEEYLRRHWPVLSRLRTALRTEPGVRLAVLFGSVARGSDHPRSDVDILVDLSDPSPRRVAELARRLSERVGRDVQIVGLADARNSATLMAAAIEDGRVLVDRGKRWPVLVGEGRHWRRRAKEEVMTLEDVPDWIEP